MDYWRHLSGRGVIALVLQEPPLLLRTMLTALEALQRQGLSRQQALECMAVVSVPAAMYPLGPYRHLLIICRQPLSPAQSARLAKEAIALGFEPGYFPHALEPVPFSWLTQHNVRTKEFIHAWNQWLFGRPLLNISPCSDDQPFVVDLTFHVPRQFIALLLRAAALAFFVFSVCHDFGQFGGPRSRCNRGGALLRRSTYPLRGILLRRIRTLKLFPILAFLCYHQQAQHYILRF